MPIELTLPLARAMHVDYELGIVAVEGSAESEVQVKTAMRKVDVGRLAEADYQPGRRLLGAFGYAGDGAEVKVAIARPAGYELPTVIVQRAELLTMVSASGRSQTAARFQLRCKAQLIDAQLPTGSTLWSAYFDGKPTQPQREGDSLLIELPATSDARDRDLQLVYETPINTLGLASSFDLAAPKLLLRGQGGAKGSEVPLADLVWRLSTPYGTKVVRSDGTVFSGNIAVRESPVAQVASGLTEFAYIEKSHSAWPVVTSADSSRSMAPSPRSEAAQSSFKADLKSVDKAEAKYDHFAQDDDRSGATKDSELRPTDQAQGAAPASAANSADKSADATVPAIPATPSVTATIQEPYDYGPAHQDTPQSKQSLWALEGVRSLPIDIQADQIQTTFLSLGEAPRLDVMVVDQVRSNLLGWCVGLSGLFMGSDADKRFIQAAIQVRNGDHLSVSFGLPLVLPWTGLISPICNMAFYAACWLLPYYLVVAFVRFIIKQSRSSARFSTGSRRTVPAPMRSAKRWHCRAAPLKRKIPRRLWPFRPMRSSCPTIRLGRIRWRR